LAADTGGKGRDALQMVAIIVTSLLIGVAAGVIVTTELYKSKLQNLEVHIPSPGNYSTDRNNTTYTLPTPKPPSVNLEDFLKGKQVAVFYFYSPNCPHCANVTPYVHGVINSSEFGWVNFYLFNVDELNETTYLLAGKYNVMYIPTIVIDGFFPGSPVLLVGEEQVRSLENVLRDIHEELVEIVR